MINQLLADFSRIISQGSYWAPIIALLAGFITSLTPCSLASVPLIIGYVKGSGQADTKKSFALSLIFVIGMSITFIGIGIASGILGRLVGAIGGVWYILMGILLMMLAIQIWGIYYFIKPTTMVNKTKQTSYLGAGLSGILAGFFSSPCATPVMLALVSIVIATDANLLWGGLLFLMYAIGHSIITVIAGTYSVFVTRLMTGKGYKNIAKLIEIVLGFLVFLLGLYFIYLGM